MSNSIVAAESGGEAPNQSTRNTQCWTCGVDLPYKEPVFVPPCNGCKTPGSCVSTRDCGPTGSRVAYELLEALMFFVNHPGVSQLCAPNSKAMLAARAVIAKATGEAK